MRFRTDIQGLRAVAVIPVLLFHFGVPLMPGGFTGVDVFFCISGFVIAGSVLKDIQAGRFSIANFYVKRVRRIFPALAATLAATTIAAAFILLPGDLIAYSKSLLATGTFWSNIYFWKSSGYFAATAQTQPLLHTWSLAIEEQFYVVAPLAFALIYRLGRQRWLTYLLPVAAISFAVSLAAVFTAPAAGFFLLPSRAWELLVGAMLALSGRPAPANMLVREATAWSGLALILLGVLALHESDPFPGWNALLPCIGAGLIIHAGSKVERLPTAGRLLSTAPMQWIGNISYSLYLVHWPITAFSRYAALSTFGAAQAAAMLVASIGLAALSWRYIEEPLRHARSRLRVLTAGVAMMAAVAAVAGVGIAARGFPARYPGYVHRQVAGNEEWGGSQCFNLDPTKPLSWNQAACTRIRGSRGRILLWGDSFAAQYLPGILRDRERIDANVLQYTFAGCPPILSYNSFARIGCAPSNRAALDLIRAQQIDTVVLSARWTDTPRRTLLQLHDTVDRLRRMGLRVVVFGQSPEFLADVQQIDFISGNYKRGGTVRWPVAFPPDINTLLAKQARGAIFVNPVAALCGGRACPYRRGDAFLYADFGHFSTVGATIAVRRYFPTGRLAQRRPWQRW